MDNLEKLINFERECFETSPEIKHEEVDFELIEENGLKSSTENDFFFNEIKLEHEKFSENEDEKAAKETSNEVKLEREEFSDDDDEVSTVMEIKYIRDDEESTSVWNNSAEGEPDPLAIKSNIAAVAVDEPDLLTSISPVQNDISTEYTSKKEAMPPTSVSTSNEFSDYSVVKFLEDLTVICCSSKQLKQIDVKGVIMAPRHRTHYPAVILAHGKKSKMEKVLRKTKRIDKIINRYHKRRTIFVEETKCSYSTPKFCTVNEYAQTSRNGQTIVKLDGNKGNPYRRLSPLLSLKCVEDVKIKLCQQKSLTEQDDTMNLSSFDPESSTYIVPDNEGLHTLEEDVIYLANETLEFRSNSVCQNLIDETDKYFEKLSRKESDCNVGKKFFCIFCKKWRCPLYQHLESCHNEEEEVSRLLSFKRNSKESRNLLNLIRRKGSLLFNTSCELNMRLSP